MIKLNDQHFFGRQPIRPDGEQGQEWILVATKNDDLVKDFRVGEHVQQQLFVLLVPKGSGTTAGTPPDFRFIGSQADEELKNDLNRRATAQIVEVAIDFGVKGKKDLPAFCNSTLVADQLYRHRKARDPNYVPPKHAKKMPPADISSLPAASTASANSSAGPQTSISVNSLTGSERPATWATDPYFAGAIDPMTGKHYVEAVNHLESSGRWPGAEPPSTTFGQMPPSSRAP